MYNAENSKRIFTNEPNVECGKCGHKFHFVPKSPNSLSLVICKGCGEVISDKDIIELKQN